jgi:hypothetical protein
MNVTRQRCINDLVDQAHADLEQWRGRGGSFATIAHAYSCLGNALKLIKAEQEE